MILEARLLITISGIDGILLSALFGCFNNRSNTLISIVKQMLGRVQMDRFMLELYSWWMKRSMQMDANQS